MKNLPINTRVSVEKILTENWDSPMVMRNAIFNGFSRDGVAHILTDEFTTYETFNRGGSGHYYLSNFQITETPKKGTIKELKNIKTYRLQRAAMLQKAIELGFKNSIEAEKAGFGNELKKAFESIK